MMMPNTALFIGSLHLPYPLHRKREETWREYDERVRLVTLVDPRVSFQTAQTGGMICNQQSVFGCFFELPGELSEFCSDTCYSSPVSFATIMKYEKDLSRYGLGFYGTGYAKLEEGFISGIHPEALLNYIISRKLKLYSSTDGWIPNSFSSLEEVLTVINKAYDAVPDSLFRINFPIWDASGVIIYPNCD